MLERENQFRPTRVDRIVDELHISNRLISQAESRTRNSSAPKLGDLSPIPMEPDHVHERLGTYTKQGIQQAVRTSSELGRTVDVYC